MKDEKTGCKKICIEIILQKIILLILPYITHHITHQPVSCNIGEQKVCIILSLSMRHTRGTRCVTTCYKRMLAFTLQGRRLTPKIGFCISAERKKVKYFLRRNLISI